MDTAELPGDQRRRTRDMLLSLVDTKLMLGYHYRERAPRSPSVDDANALQGMSAGEFGQAYHLMDLLEALGESAEELERRRSPEQYSSIDVLDREPEGWENFLAAVGLADLAALVRLESWAASGWDQIEGLTRKAVQEEEFHVLYLHGACESYIATNPALRQRFCARLEVLLPLALRWFGRDHHAGEAEAVLSRSPAAERAVLLDRVGSYGRPCSGPPRWSESAAIDWTDWSDERFRSTTGSPSPAAVATLALEDIDRSIKWERGAERMV